MMQAKNTSRAGLLAMAAFLVVGCADDGDDVVPMTDSGANTTTGGADASATGDDAGSTGGSTGEGGATTSTSTTGDDAGAETGMTVVDIAVGDPRFSVLVAALTRADLVDALSGPGPFTVFAPTDDAFTALLGEIGATSLDDIDDETLTLFLKNHVIAGEVLAADIPTDPPVADNLAELTLFFGTEDGVTVNEATVTQADVKADNGVIHVIDDVINPADIPAMAQIAGLDSLVAALTEAEIDVGSGSAAEPYTIFAPTDEAFAALLEALGVDGVSDIPDEVLLGTLLYHAVGGAAVAAGALDEGVNIVSTLASPDYTDSDTAMPDMMTLVVARDGDAVMANGANVVLADIRTVNGIVHVVDAVITRPTIVDMVGIAGLTELGNAVGAAADIPGTPPTPVAVALAGKGPLTVFAPTNAAFEAITAPSDAGDLRDVLLYHVVSGDVTSDELSAGDVPTLAGATVSVELPEAGGVTVTGGSNTSAANVVIADVVVSNGVVHVIDQVLLP